MYSILSKLGLVNRIINDIDELPEVVEPIDYSVINPILNREIERSKNWLSNQIQQGLLKNKSMSAYDILDDRCDKLSRDFVIQKSQVHDVKNWIFKADDQIKDIHNWVYVTSDQIKDMLIKLENLKSEISIINNYKNNSDVHFNKIEEYIVQLQQYQNEFNNKLLDMEQKELSINRKVETISEKLEEIETIKKDIVELKKSKLTKLKEKLHMRRSI